MAEPAAAFRGLDGVFRAALTDGPAPERPASAGHAKWLLSGGEWGWMRLRTLLLPPMAARAINMKGFA